MNTRIILDTTYLPLICNEKELKSIVEDYISIQDYSFSFKDLCLSIERIAERDDLFEKERNTEYRGRIKLNGIDLKTITLTIWEMIWDKKLIINFAKDEYRNDDEFSFIKC